LGRFDQSAAKAKARKGESGLVADIAKSRTGNDTRGGAPPPPPEDPIHEYLSRVYRLRCRVASSAELQSALKAHHKARSPKTLQQYAGVIIQLTAGDHITSNMKYKYVAALEYAFADDVKPQNLKAFIKLQGGLNRCVELWKKKRGRKPQKKPRKKKP
jgi:hypothetical protein